MQAICLDTSFNPGLGGGILSCRRQEAGRVDLARVEEQFCIDVGQVRPYLIR